MNVQENTVTCFGF